MSRPPRSAPTGPDDSSRRIRIQRRPTSCWPPGARSDDQPECPSEFESHEASTAVAFSPDGHQLAQGTSEGAVRIWDVDARHVICTLPGHDAWVEAASFAPNGELVATGAQDSSVRLWDPLGCRSAAASITGFREDVTAVEFSADGRELAMSSLDGTVARQSHLRSGQRQPATWRVET